MATDEVYWQPFRMPEGINDLPAISFDTSAITDAECAMKVIDHTLAAGYRGYDTTASAGNETALGKAFQALLPKYGLTREDIHITSKLSNAEHCNKARLNDSYKKTCLALGSEPDIYLIHFPAPQSNAPKENRNKRCRYEAWAGLVQMFNDGIVTAIGVSNFTVENLKDLYMKYHSDIPVVNQVEWHPYSHNEDVLNYCNANGIVLQGYQSQGASYESLVSHPIVEKIADHHSVQPPQVLSAWSLQRGVAVLTKSIKPRHIDENIDVKFKLSFESMNKLNNLKALSDKPRERINQLGRLRNFLN